MRNIFVFLLMIVPWQSALGAVVTDGTVGPASALPGPNYAITDSLGTQVGTNLFHSFSTFDLAAAETATFSGPASIANIISRVTGGNTSYIDGTLSSSIVGANLFLLNPAGVMFGPNAALDLTGSFHASTASSLNLGQDGVFPADTVTTAVLTTDPPSAFGFLNANPAAISVDGSLLTVDRGESINLTGGDITISDANLWANSGTINLVSVDSAGTVNISGNQLTPSGFTSMGTITLQDSRAYGDLPYYSDPDAPPIMAFLKMSNVDTSGHGGGTISIHAGSFVSTNAVVFNDTLGNVEGGQTVILADQDVTFINSQLTCNSIYNDAQGADIYIDSRNLTLNDSLINTAAFTYSGVSSSDINLSVAENLQLNGLSEVNTTAFGAQSGDIVIDANNLSVGPSAQIISSSTVLGSYPLTGAGTITISVGNNVDLAGRVRSDTLDGSSGTVSISTDTLNMTGAGNISTSLLANLSTEERTSGNIDITANDIYMADDTRIVSRVSRSLSGYGGNIDITTDNITLLDRSAISTSVDSDNGAGGTLTIQASDTITVASIPGSLETEKGGLTSDTTAGTAGTIILDAKDIVINDGGTVSTIALGPDSIGGNIVMNATGQILVDGYRMVDSVLDPSSIESDTLQNGVAGSIDLTAPSIVVQNHGLISSAALPGSSGAAGNLTLSAADLLRVENASLSTRSAVSTGGNISVDAPGLVHIIDGELTATATGGSGDGGNISIDGGSVVLNRGVMTAQADAGDGGNLLISADLVLISSDSFLSASSRLGAEGTIIIDAPYINVADALASPAIEFVDPNAFLPKQCLPPEAANASSFRVEGSSGMPLPVENSFPPRSF